MSFPKLCLREYLSGVCVTWPSHGCTKPQFITGFTITLTLVNGNLLFLVIVQLDAQILFNVFIYL